MKKLFTILFLMLALCGNAQHLKFMGIPLNVTINEFQARLANKGISPNKHFNANTALGNRGFNGLFCGNKADFYSYYNPKSKIVYRCKACIDNREFSYIERKYDEIKRMLEDKYPSSDIIVDSYGGFKSCWLEVFGGTGLSPIGIIEMYISKYDEQYPTIFTLHIDYTDYANSKKNETINSDDL